MAGWQDDVANQLAGGRPIAGPILQDWQKDIVDQLGGQGAPQESLAFASPYRKYGPGEDIANSILLGGYTPLAAAVRASTVQPGMAPQAGSWYDRYLAAKGDIGKDQEAYDKTGMSLLTSTLPAVPSTVLGIAAGGAGVEPAVANIARIAPRIGAALRSPVIRGAAEGAASGLLQTGLTDRPTSQDVAEGTATGAVLGPFSALLRKPFASNIDPGIASVARNLMDFGIPLRAGDVPGASWTARAAGAFGDPTRMQKGFTQALSRTFGEDTPNTGYDTIMRAQRKLGGELDRLGATVQIPQSEPQLSSDLAAMRPQLSAASTPIYSKVTRVLDEIEDRLHAGTLDGAALQSLRSPGGSLGKMLYAKDGGTRHAGQEIQLTLNDAIDRNAPPDTLAALAETRRLYKNTTIADQVTDEATGLADPKKLLPLVERKYGTANTARTGDMGTLAMGGKHVMPGLDEALRPEPTLTGKEMLKTAAYGTAAGHFGAEPAAELLGAIPGIGHIATGGGIAYGGALLAHGKTMATERGTKNLLDSVAGRYTPWWYSPARLGVNPTIPLVTRSEQQAVGARQ